MSHVTPAYGQLSAEMANAKQPFATMCARCKRMKSALNRLIFGSRARPSDDDGEEDTAPFAGEGSSRSASTVSDYTELHRGSVPCPSCKGTGLIPKELESTLVALIPVNDERLKPKKTWLVVSAWVLFCVFIGVCLLFLLMPRTVMLSSNRTPVEVVNVTDHNESLSFIDFNFLNHINVTSGNYIPVDLTKLSVTIVSRFQPWSTDIVGTGKNVTISALMPLVLYRSTREVAFNNSVTLKDVVA
uniref:Transmembrane protein 106A n=1 Tax=Globodera rostochiensis TaxID=31243 RepID=A0A914HHX8_GLORO